jgi:hypothetical protein
MKLQDVDADEDLVSFDLNDSDTIYICGNVFQLHLGDSCRKACLIQEIVRVEYHDTKDSDILSLHLRGDPNPVNPRIKISNLRGIKTYNEDALFQAYNILVYVLENME